ncbi:MAG: class I SAM-dependent methyltransferase [Bacteroidetes bacterium]|nr:class I SAM-dependent methyltransferase [Bacteroidota bacterium]
MSAIYPSVFARFYDLIYDRIRAGVDSDFFLEKISEAKGPVLEVGTGTGRFFSTALSHGADIYGIDISPAMLDVLKNRIPAEDHKRVSVQDIREFKHAVKFRLIIAPFRVFMHLTETQDQLKALNHVHDNLSEDGLFIFDLYIPDPGLLSKGLKNVMDFEGEYEPEKVVRRFVTAENDLVNQINYLSMRFEWDEDGKILSETWHSELRFFFRYELEYLLQRSKFSSYELFGDYQGNPLSSASKEFVVVCRK